MITYFLLTAFSILGWTSDEGAKAKITQADGLYKDRADLTKVDQALTLLDQAAQEATSNDVKFDALVHQSYTLYFLGTRQTEKSQKVKTFLDGDNKAREAIKIGDYADAYYWSAANLGRWGETMGVLQSLGRKDELIKILKTISEKDTLNNEAGETYASYGADRILGRVYAKLPSFAGGSRPQALALLKRSYEKGGGWALSAFYYADALASGSADEKGEAKRILDKLLANDPKTFDPDRVPETEDEFELARKLRSELGKLG